METIIKPESSSLSINWRELWRFRDLFIVLAWRDISVRYKQTVLGVVWALFQPLVTMLIFTFIFNRMAKIESGDGTPYPVFLFVGLLLWQYYSNTLTNASNSMISNSALIQKVYFPRLIIPSTAATTSLVDLLLASLLLTGMMFYYGYCPRLVGVVILPIVVVSILASAVGAGLFLAALNVRYRDVRYALPFLIQILMYVTPVIYPVKMLDSHPAIKTAMIWLNPISGLITAARAALLGGEGIDAGTLLTSVFMSGVMFVFGLYYFKNTERFFADIV